MIKCYDDEIYEPKIKSYTAKKEDEDIGEKFVEEVEKSVKEIYSRFKYKKKVEMTDEDEEDFNEATHCRICEKLLAGDKVIYHDHLSGRYRGAAHNGCNMNYEIPKFIPVVFHNLARYDAHLFIKNLGVSDGKVDCIPNNEEKYISFKKQIVVDSFEKGGKVIDVKREIRFIDSFKFMSTSLNKLVVNLGKDKFRNMGKFYSGEKLDLLLRKGVYPYVSSLGKLKDRK